MAIFEVSFDTIDEIVAAAYYHALVAHLDRALVLRVLCFALQHFDLGILTTVWDAAHRPLLLGNLDL